MVCPYTMTTHGLERPGSCSNWPMRSIADVAPRIGLSGLVLAVGLSAAIRTLAQPTMTDAPAPTIRTEDYHG